MEKSLCFVAAGGSRQVHLQFPHHLDVTWSTTKCAMYVSTYVITYTGIHMYTYTMILNIIMYDP